MRRPLPRVAGVPGVQTGTPTPTPLPTPTPTPAPAPGVTPAPAAGIAAYGWQPSCTDSSATAACVRLIEGKDFLVPASECPATQSAGAEAVAHSRGLFGMNDGVSAATRDQVCGAQGPKSYFVAYGTCDPYGDSGSAYLNTTCVQAFVDQNGAVTARQYVDGGRCISQPTDGGYAAIAAGSPLVPGGTVVAPADFYSSSGQPCTQGIQSQVERVTAGHCLDEGGYVCNSFEVAKDAKGAYRLLRTTPTGSSQCYGGGGSQGANDFVKSLGYDVVQGYYGGLQQRCQAYPTYGATSVCETRIVSKPGGGYDVKTGLQVDCKGVQANRYNPDWVDTVDVPTSRCESAPAPTDEQKALIAKAELLPYEEAKAKDCSSPLNFNYNLQAKVLPGGFDVRRGEKTYEYPTAAMRAARTPREGDQYGEYTDMVYEGTFNISLVCTDIASGGPRIGQSGDSYWDGPYDSSVYSGNHSFAIDKKEACAVGKEALYEPYGGAAYYYETILTGVGERWANQPTCYEPSYGVADVKEFVPSGTDGAIFRLNRCSPLRTRWFTWNGSSWVPGEYQAGNPPL